MHLLYVGENVWSKSEHSSNSTRNVEQTSSSCMLHVLTSLIQQTFYNNVWMCSWDLRTANARFLRETNVVVLCSFVSWPWFCMKHVQSSSVQLLGCRPIRGGVVIKTNLIGHNLEGPVFLILILYSKPIGQGQMREIDTFGLWASALCASCVNFHMSCALLIFTSADVLAFPQFCPLRCCSICYGVVPVNDIFAQFSRCKVGSSVLLISSSVRHSPWLIFQYIFAQSGHTACQNVKANKPSSRLVWSFHDCLDPVLWHNLRTESYGKTA